MGGTECESFRSNPGKNTWLYGWIARMVAFVALLALLQALQVFIWPSNSYQAQWKKPSLSLNPEKCDPRCEKNLTVCSDFHWRSNSVDLRSQMLPKLYGHLHMAKTAGTTLNLMLAAKYERICGHKGYSYDSFQENQKRGRTSDESGAKQKPDIINQLFPKYSRSRVPHSVMVEIGFEDCDYISHETNWKFWPTFFERWYKPLEIHIPCRDPVEHLMSMCNHKGIKFQCDIPLIDAIQHCMLDMGRFSMKLVHGYSNITTKCFSSEAVDDYVQYMGQTLQHKQLPSSFVLKATNKPREAANECVWGNPTILQKVNELLLSHFDYYQYCEQCLGSVDDLLAF